MSVRRFGVKGDGVTDDTAALQVALNAGIPLYFPPGTYLYGNTLKATASIVGAGWDSILQCTTSQGQNSAIYWSGASHFNIRNLQFFSANATRITRTRTPARSTCGTAASSKSRGASSTMRPVAAR
ncbi:glycosyl hydrolase family 28-related protein [Burkholderia cenocepacia]|uniref:glycosyl hydrolase family 28-related protein n=1 Tax=Burkholderia cenocepacia TaxID=95486 RepID=UPI0024B6E439|nr:glycosyl hydrolase family 28-related protein [Burkholderia cenocepacia]MDI9697436.1 glycosyl hydrolase family 28-related protein [Burkholderia cenocepacia]